MRLLVFQECALCGHSPIEIEHLLVFEFDVLEPQYGARGRIHYSRELLGLS